MPASIGAYSAIDRHRQPCSCRSTQGVKVMNVADKDKVCAVAIASTGKKKAKKAAPADENQMGLLEEESEEGTLAIDDLDDLDDDLGDEGEATEE